MKAFAQEVSRPGSRVTLEGLLAELRKDGPVEGPLERVWRAILANLREGLSADAAWLLSALAELPVTGLIKGAVTAMLGVTDDPVALEELRIRNLVEEVDGRYRLPQEIPARDRGHHHGGGAPCGRGHVRCPRCCGSTARSPTSWGARLEHPNRERPRGVVPGVRAVVPAAVRRHLPRRRAARVGPRRPVRDRRRADPLVRAGAAVERRCSRSTPGCTGWSSGAGRHDLAALARDPDGRPRTGWRRRFGEAAAQLDTGRHAHRAGAERRACVPSWTRGSGRNARCSRIDRGTGADETCRWTRCPSRAWRRRRC